MAESPHEQPSKQDPEAPASGVPPADNESRRKAIEDAARSLYQQGRNGSNWFYWVAGLSLVNSVILHTGGNVFFVVGLGVTMVADVLAAGVAEKNPNIAGTVRAAAFGLDILASLIVAAFGWLASRRYLALFAIGMVLYLLDGLLFVLVQDWMSVGFHVFALFCMWGGFMAYRRLNALETAYRSSPV
jgi:hypothetical protein